MKRKYKLTGCARFLIFLIIIGPIIYISATMITGTSPLEEINKLLGREDTAENIHSPSPSENLATDTLNQSEQVSEQEVPDDEQIQDEASSQTNDLRKKLEEIEKRMDVMEREIEEIKNRE